MILKGKTLLSVLVTSLLVTCTKKPIQYDWKPVSYKTVKAYFLTTPQLVVAAMNVGMIDGPPKDLFDKIKNEKGVELSKEQIARISTLFSVQEENLEYYPADCFNPRHVIVYYNAKDEPIAVIAACFECGNLLTYPDYKKKIPLYNYLENFRPFFAELGMPVFSNPVEYNAYMDSLQKVEKIKK